MTRKMEANNLTIIRHGNTFWNTLGKVQGSADIDLDEKGIHEAMNVSKKLEILPIELIVTSPLKRAVHTAQLLNVKGLPLKIENDLAELHFGDWEGMAWNEIREKYNDYILHNTINGYATPPSGESYDEAYARISSITDRIIEMPYNNIAIVTHRAVIRFMLAHLLKVSLENINTFQLPNTAMIRLSKCKVENTECWKVLDEFR